MKWLDTSSWSRGETKGDPKEWTVRVGDQRICIHHQMGESPENWICSVQPIGLRFEMKETDVKLVKAEAINRVAGYLDALLAQLRKVKP